MSDEDYDQGFAEGYYQGLSTDKETSFLILAARIDELKKENEKLRAALKPFADVAENDIGDDEADDDMFRPITKRFSRALLLTVGDLRAVAKALKETDNG